MNVDSQPTNKDTKVNKTEVRLAQTYKNYKVYGQDLIVKVDKNGVITTVSGKVVQNLDQQPNLTITNFLSKNEVKSKLRDILQILSDATATKLSIEILIFHDLITDFVPAISRTLNLEKSLAFLSLHYESLQLNLHLGYLLINIR